MYCIDDSDPFKLKNVSHIVDSYHDIVKDLYYVVLRKYKYTLNDYMSKYGQCSLDRVGYFGKQLIETLVWLHDDIGIIHTNINTETIVMFDDYHDSVCITDFKSSKNIKSKQINCHKVSESSFRAPEANGGILWNEKIDVWSLAIVLIDLYLGRNSINNSSNCCGYIYKFEHYLDKKMDKDLKNKIMCDNENCIYKNFIKNNLDFSKTWKSISNNLEFDNESLILKYKETIKDFIQTEYSIQNTKSIWTILDESIVSGPFVSESIDKMTQFKDLLKCMLEYNPNKRWSMKQCFDHEFFK